MNVTERNIRAKQRAGVFTLQGKNLARRLAQSFVGLLVCSGTDALVTKAASLAVAGIARAHPSTFTLAGKGIGVRDHLDLA